MTWSLQTSSSLDNNQFEQWRKLLEERTGIQLAEKQKLHLQSQLSMRMRELGYESYAEYYEKVTAGLTGQVEWTVLVDRLVVKETTFFRHRPSIEYVRAYLQQRINNQTLQDSFDVWSVGCASGEEPYSLAMALNDCFELATLNPYFGVTATDISMTALAAGREGIYHGRKLIEVTPHERSCYFKTHGQDSVRCVEKLRDRVCFHHGNVLNMKTMPSTPMDVIYCQNLLVYFRRWLRRDILNEFVERLKPGGILVIGLGEIVEWTHPKMQRVRNDQVQAYIRQS